uniref:Uncharacterized protein n=1 Tax=Moniliophthora roreri TaxID=221103 RepID=A0A0W0G768_MONRR
MSAYASSLQRGCMEEERFRVARAYAGKVVSRFDGSGLGRQARESEVVLRLESALENNNWFDRDRVSLSANDYTSLKWKRMFRPGSDSESDQDIYS